MQTGLHEFCHSIRTSVALIDGQMQDDDFPLDTSAKNKKKATVEAGDSPLKNFDVELFAQVVNNF